jgi:hypothetical protein
MGADCGMAHPDSWAVIAYFITVALGIMLSLSSREDFQVMLSKIIQQLHKRGSVICRKRSSTFWD